MPPPKHPMPAKANLDREFELISSNGHLLIAGIDEAGRGAVAGPVYAAAVILDLDDALSLSELVDVDDSKQKTANQREELYALITKHSLAFGIGSKPSEIIDRDGIISANAQAMMLAVAQLDPNPEYLLIDGRMRLKNLAIRQEPIIRGDAKSLSIAAASILAKVSRDRHMIRLAQRFPGYGFERNKGYCTPEHIAALEKLGPTPVHRYSFAPIRTTLL
ncbi:MAG: ribonuclease HII [Candidatus Promineifilaceae bacterium]